MTLEDGHGSLPAFFSIILAEKPSKVEIRPDDGPSISVSGRIVARWSQLRLWSFSGSPPVKFFNFWINNFFFQPPFIVQRLCTIEEASYSLMFS